jgi:chemotaxis methyl-accepting protein methylase
MNKEIKKILNLIIEKKNLDFSGNRPDMLGRRILIRQEASGKSDMSGYYLYIKNNNEELEKLTDSLTIKVSRFFRNSMTFNYLYDQVLPLNIRVKSSLENQEYRIWVAGCATGEEAYSIAILLNELLEKEKINIPIYIFATDINKNTLKAAKQGVYSEESIKNVRFFLFRKYFKQKKESFHLNNKIKKMVSFSIYDLLDKKSNTPPESIFGGFDMVFCRNVLIYYNPEYQEIIFSKLFNSLNTGGSLILGKAEIPLKKYSEYFQKLNNACYIYKKNK